MGPTRDALYIIPRSLRVSSLGLPYHVTRSLSERSPSLVEASVRAWTVACFSLGSSSFSSQRVVAAQASEMRAASVELPITILEYIVMAGASSEKRWSRGAMRYYTIK